MRVAARTPARGGLSSTTALCGLLGATLLAHAFSGPANAANLPQGGTVAAGSASISQSGKSLTVNQSSDRAVINWQSFGIGVDANVRFQQPSSDSITLNRVTGNAPSNILGTLSANGSVWILNPNGILFGRTARVDTAGLVATTSNITDSDFMAGRYVFDKMPGSTGAVVNMGTITIQGGGLAALVAPSVRNSGVISANLGRVALAAGDAFTVDFYGDKLIQFALPTGAGPDVDVTNSGTIRADGGHVQISAATAAGIVSGVVNMTGIVEARRVGVEDGVIVLDGGEAGAVTVAGTLDASGRDAGGAGGTVKVLGDQVALTRSAKLDASGDTGGGTVLVGGNYQGKGPERNARTTTIAAGATLKADAATNGNGGTVVAWADGNTRFDGRITARGGAQGGNGGLVETSGKAGLSVGAAAVVDASAPMGQAGNWLLDPDNLIIASSGTDSLDAPGNPVVAASVVEAALQNKTTVTLAATNSISINAEIDTRDQTNASTLEFIDHNGDDNLTVNLNADIKLGVNQKLTGGATTVNVGPGGRIQNGVDVAGDGATVNVATGTYNENVTINKRLTLDGAGAGKTIIDPTSGSAVTIGGTIGENATVTLDGITFRDAPVAGVQVASNTKLGTLTIQNSEFQGNGHWGFAVSDGAAGLAAVNILNTSFNANGAQSTTATSLGLGDLLFFQYNGNATLRDVKITGHATNGANNAIQFRGTDAPAAAGAVVFDNVTISGDYRRPTGTVGTFNPGGPGAAIVFQNYASVANVSFQDVVLNPTVGHGLFVAGLGTTLNIGNTRFGTPNTSVTGTGSPRPSQSIFVGTSDQNNVQTNVNATSAVFVGAANGFAIEDRVFHALDHAGLGVIRFDANNVYVTQNSDSIQRGLDAANAGDTVRVGAGEFTEDLSVRKDVSVIGSGTGSTTIKPKTDTTAFNLDAGSGWITVAQGVEFNLSDVALDGSGRNIYHGILHRGHGVIDNVAFKNIRYDRYYGIAVRVLGGPSAGSVDITNSTFANIGRIGAHFGDASTGSFVGNVYTGKGDGDHLDYGVEVGRGGKAVIRNNTITNNTGVASTDGSTSAGILVTTFFPPAGTQATIENNFINGNTVGVHVGYDRNDRSVVTITGNDLSGNTRFAIVSTRPIVFAPFNWYGATTPAGVQAQLDGPVVFVPFLTSGVDISSASGFQGSPSAIFPRPSQAPPTPPGLSNQTPPPPPSPGTNPGGVAFNGDLTAQPVVNVFGQGFGLGLGGLPDAPPPGQGGQGGPTIPVVNLVQGGTIVSGAPERVGGPSDPSADHANQYANSLLDNFAVGSGGSSNDSE